MFLLIFWHKPQAAPAMSTESHGIRYSALTDKCGLSAVKSNHQFTKRKIMSKFLSALLAGVFAVVTLSPVAFAQEKKDEKAKAEAKKTDGKKKAEEKKAEKK
jgi:phosphate/sulfate permease